MKRRLLRHKFALWIITALTLASCSQEELAEQGTPLPDGMYPMTFTAMQVAPENMPQTRVSDSENTSSWSVGDQIHVTVTQGNAKQETICTLDASGNITEYNPQLYWQNTSDATINAWYSNIEGQNTGTGSTVRLADQSGGLAYVLKAVPVTANYKTEIENIALKFSHQLAKIRVKLTGEKAESVNDVKIESYTSCTNTNGTVSTDGASVGEIAMYRVDNSHIYEANVVPGKEIKKFKVNDGDWVDLSTTFTPEKGQLHEITINVKQASLQPGADGKFTVNGGDDVLIKDYTGTEPIVVNGTATITLDNVQLTTEGTAMEINNGATVTLNVVGKENSLVSTNGSGIGAHENCNITIKGEGTGNSKLTVSSGEGRNVGIGFIMGMRQGTINYGNIEISDVTLSVTASSGGGDNEGAAIGVTANVNGGWQSQAVVGNITITNSNVTASSKRGAACIGTSFWENTYQPLTMDVISIKNSTVTATNNEKGDWLPACIGMGVVYAGSVTIQKIEIEKSTLNLTTNAQYKVGKGVVYDTATITEGIFVDRIHKGNEGWNP